MISHRLLRRQLRKVLGVDTAIPEEWEPLLALVDDAYRQFDGDRDILHRSMDVSSDELMESNDELRREKARHDVILERLKRSLKELRTDATVEDFDEEDVLSISDLIRKQVAYRNTAEAALREREQRLRLILASTRDYAIYTLDPDGRINSWNAAANRMTGYSEDQILGQDHTLFNTPDERSSESGNLQLKEAALTGETSIQGWRMKMDGTLFWADVTLSALRNESGTLQGFVCVSRDITERRNAQEALRISKEKAEAASRAKSEFLANMSHEIRTPMNAIVGLTDILQRSELTDDQKQIVDTIQTSGQGLLRIIQDILDISKMDAGKLTLVNNRFDLRACVGGVVDLFVPTFCDRPVQFSMEYASDVPEWVTSDEARVRQILINLVGNAARCTPKGEVTVYVSAQPTRSKTQIQFQIRDTGIGIPAEALPTLFDPFTQVTDERTHGLPGTGLGLTICKRFVEALGGEIWVESQPEAGSTFHFTINVEAQQRKADRPVSGQDPAPQPVKTPVATRILVAEDHPVNQLVVRRLLESIGHDCIIVPNGRKAVDHVLSIGCDVIFMDVQMPEMNGIEATQHIRANPSIKQPCIIALTAFAMAEDRERCLDAGMDYFLAKPVIADDLRRALDGIAA